MQVTTKNLGAIIVFAVAGWSGSASAICSGAASPDALKGFVANPASWLDSNGSASDLGPRAKAQAAAAVNSKDPGFGKALSAVLGKASGDQGTAIGKSLGGLSASCHDTTDPDDVADKKYISENILPNIAANSAANVAFGDASGPQTASTGGGGGGGGAGTGVGGSTGNTGASGTGGNGGGGVTDTNNTTATQFTPSFISSSSTSVPSTGTTGATTGTTGGITTNTTINSSVIP